MGEDDLAADDLSGNDRRTPELDERRLFAKHAFNRA
jgi:hypothetical protein